MIASPLMSSWCSSPRPLQLTGNAIHLWYALLEQSQEQIAQFYQTLSLEECTRAKRFYFERDRQHFIVGRGVLRNILGRYVGIEPQKLQFCYGAHGKPALLQLCGNDILSFNVSHSQGLALYAVALNREVGVDVEHMRYLEDAEQIAENFFSLRERRTLHALADHIRTEAFFCCWTRKEAYVKALGDGLSQPLDGFDVSLTPGEAAELLAIQGQPEELKHWKLFDISLPSLFASYKAALVVENMGCHAEPAGFWQWQKEGV
jgi:4'-phosphopantetheinyl transferase